MNTSKIFCVIILLFGSLSSSYSQDLLRVGITHDFNEKKAIESFSLEYNMTNKEESRPARYLLFSGHGIYLLPSSGINLGDGISSSENNVFIQMKAGKTWFGNATGNTGTYVLNKSIEINPSYNSDKNFQEILAFGQLKFILGFIGAKYEHADGDVYVKSAFSAALSPFTNVGYRWSKSYDLNKMYSTAGIAFNLSNRYAVKIEKDVIDDLSFKLTGSVYYIASESEKLTTDKYAGMLKATINKRIYNNAYFGLSYKYGNDNPAYIKLNVLELNMGIYY